MSHFTCAVIHRKDQDIEEMLAPYDESLQVEPYVVYTRQQAIDYARENYDSCKNASDEECWKYMAEDYDSDAEGNLLSRYNRNSAWDWWTVGGRWSGMLKTRHGSADSARIGDIDFSLDQAAFNGALRFWDVIVEGKPQNPGENFFSIYKPEYYKDIYGDRETYARHQAQFSTYAVVTPDGAYHSKGKMGWWAMSSETPEEARRWEDTYMERFIESADRDLILTIVNLHI